MEILTSALTGHALDWAVGVAEGYNNETYMRNMHISLDVKGKCSMISVPHNQTYIAWAPSVNRDQAMTIIDRERIAIEPCYINQVFDGWRANRHDLRYDAAGEFIPGSDNAQSGPTPLIAAMRSFVSYKLGGVLDVPETLLSERQSTLKPSHEPPKLQQHYTVTGRLPGADEDETIYVGYQRDQASAIVAFQEELAEDLSAKERAEIARKHTGREGVCVFVTSVIASNTPMRISTNVRVDIDSEERCRNEPRPRC